MPNSHLHLTDAIHRYSDGYPSMVSISNDGKQAYLVYGIEETVTTEVIAEMFDLNHGKFVSKAVLHPDPDTIQPTNPVSCDGGFANPDFTKFCLLEDNQGGPDAGPIGRIRIRIFDRDFNTLASRRDIQFAVGTPQVTFSVLGGQFSADGRYVEITYMVDVAKQIFRLHILKASDLSDVAITDLNGSTFRAYFFQLHSKPYLAVAVQNGLYEFGFNSPIGATESNLLIYKLKRHSLQLVTSHKLAQIANYNSIYSMETRCGTLLGVPTRRAIVDSSIFRDDSQNRALTRQGQEVELFRFNGKKLELILSEKLNLSAYGPVFCNQDDLVIVGDQLSDGNPATFQLYQWNQACLKAVSGPYGSPPFPMFAMSRNGKWLIVAGTDQDPALNNLNLYRFY